MIRRRPGRRQSDRSLGSGEARAWNNAHPVGTAVRLLAARGRVIRTVTTGPAWTLCTGRAAVPVRDIKGCVLLETLEVIVDTPGETVP